MSDDYWMDSRLIDTMGGHQAIEVRVWAFDGYLPAMARGERYDVGVVFSAGDMKQYRTYGVLRDDTVQQFFKDSHRAEGRLVFIIATGAVSPGGALIFPVMSTWPMQNGWIAPEPEPAEEPDPYWARGW